MMSFIVQANAIDFSEIERQVVDPSIAPSLNPVFRPGPATNLSEIINLILPYLFVIAGLLLLFYLIAAGFQMMTSPGDEKAAASAKAKITNALAGFVILFVSFWLVKLLGYILGLELL